MRPLPPAVKSIFFGLTLALAANHAQAASGTVHITAGPGAILEGSPSGSTPFVFTIAKDTALGTTMVTYTITGTATPGEDYVVPTGTINLTNATPSKNITINVKKDTKFELDETLILNLVVQGGRIPVTSGTSG